MVYNDHDNKWLIIFCRWYTFNLYILAMIIHDLCHTAGRSAALGANRHATGASLDWGACAGGKLLGNPQQKLGKSWETHGKNMGKSWAIWYQWRFSWENHGKSWENLRTPCDVCSGMDSQNHVVRNLRTLSLVEKYRIYPGGTCFHQLGDVIHKKVYYP